MKSTIYIIITMQILISCSSNKTEENTAAASSGSIITLTDAQAKNANLSMGNLEQKNITALLKVNGKIDVPPQNMISVSVALGGYLKWTNLLPGMRIKKGDLLAIMEDQQYIQLQEEYLTAKAKLDFAEKDYNRQKELNQIKANSDKIFQQSEADYIGLKVQFKSLSEKLKLIGVSPDNLNENTLSRSVNIYSPINGFVSKVNLNIGKYATPAEVLFELVNPDDIHLNLKVFEKDLDKLYVGQKLITYTNNHEKKHVAEIILISQDLSAERSAEVHCHFEDYDKTLLPGMYMNAEIEVKHGNAYVLPDDAVVQFENQQYIFVQKEKDQYEMLQVKTGIIENGYTEIMNVDSLISKKLVTKGAYTLLMGLKNKGEE